MKRILFFLLITNITFSQCNFSIENLLTLSKYNFTDFDSAVVRNGYTYVGSQSNDLSSWYKCDIEAVKDGHIQINRSVNPDKSITIAYSFFDKNEYLEFKKYLDKNGVFTKSNTEKNQDGNTLYVEYLIEKRLFYLMTTTFDKFDGVSYGIMFIMR